MKTLGASTVLLLWFVLLGLPSGDRASGTYPTVPLQELGVAALADTTDPTGVVQRYCVRCHNERLLRGNLTLEEFDVETAHERAPTAEKMIRKLRAGMMPPPGHRRPRYAPSSRRLRPWSTGRPPVTEIPARGASSGSTGPNTSA